MSEANDTHRAIRLEVKGRVTMTAGQWRAFDNYMRKLRRSKKVGIWPAKDVVLLHLFPDGSALEQRP